MTLAIARSAAVSPSRASSAPRVAVSLPSISSKARASPATSGGPP